MIEWVIFFIVVFSIIDLFRWLGSYDKTFLWWLGSIIGNTVLIFIIAVIIKLIYLVVTA